MVLIVLTLHVRKHGTNSTFKETKQCLRTNHTSKET